MKYQTSSNNATVNKHFQSICVPNNMHVVIDNMHVVRDTNA